MSARWLPFALLLLAGCALQPTQAPKSTQTSAIQNPDVEQENLLLDAKLAIKNGMSQQAIDRALDPIIVTFEHRWGYSPKRVYSARTQAETIYYLGESLARKEDAIVIGPVWAEAFELKAYALVDLGRNDEASVTLDKALALEPQQAAFLEELGARYETEKNWQRAMETFERAETAANLFTPPALHNDELARAWRGKAFVDVELGRLDEAEQLYLRCLDLDKNDKRAAAELGYVRHKRAETTQH
jgi:tetratricopeptide (TPR) repeat protein